MRLGGWSILMLSCFGRTPPHSYSCCIYVAGEPGRWLLFRISDCRSPLHLRAVSSPAGQTTPGLADSIPIEPRYVNHILEPSTILELPVLYHKRHIWCLPAHNHRALLPVMRYCSFCVSLIPSEIFQHVQDSFQRQQTIKHATKFVSQTTSLLFTLLLESHWGWPVLSHWLTCHTDSRLASLQSVAVDFLLVVHNEIIWAKEFIHSYHLTISTGSFSFFFF